MLTNPGVVFLNTVNGDEGFWNFKDCCNRQGKNIHS